MSKLSAAILLGLLGAAALVFYRHERKRQETSILELRDQIKALAETREAPRYIAVPTFRREDHAPAEAPLPARSEPLPPGASPTEPAPVKTPEIAMAERHATYEQAFARDQVDAQWAKQAKQLVDDKIGAVLPEGSSVSSFECRSKLCRLEIAHKDRDSYWKFINAAFMNPQKPLWDGLVYAMPLHDDPTEGSMVTYLAREGQPLPAVAN